MSECNSPAKLAVGSPFEPEAELSEDPVDYKASNESQHTFKSFKATSFEELDSNIQTYLREGRKRLITISCWCDGAFHYAMLGADSVSANFNTFKGQTVVNKDGQMMVQCY